MRKIKQGDTVYWKKMKAIVFQINTNNDNIFESGVCVVAYDYNYPKMAGLIVHVREEEISLKTCPNDIMKEIV